MFRMFEKHEREIENEDYLIRAYALHLRMKTDIIPDEASCRWKIEVSSNLGEVLSD